MPSSKAKPDIQRRPNAAASPSVHDEVERLKSQFLSAVSHELCTPLATMIGYLEFLQDETAGRLDPRQREYVGHVAANAQHLHALINQLLDYARLEAGRLHLVPGPVQLVELLAEMAPRLREQLGARGLSLTIEAPEPVLPVRGDLGRVVQVIAQLIDNAAKFTPAGGRVAIGLASTPGDEVLVEVRDDGIGIPSAAIDRVFSTFFQAEPGLCRERGGTGMGLAMCRRLVEAQGGRIGLESREGAGTRVWFTLPVWREADEP